MTTILVTRPEPGATATARRLMERGHTAIVAPLLTIAPRTTTLPAAQAILVTSANGLPAVLPNLPVFAVGDATAAAARARGASNVTSAGRDAAALAELVRATCSPQAGPLLLLSGARQGLPLAATLRAAGFRVLRRVTYAVVPATTLPPAAINLLQNGSGAALFFSPETAHIFVRLMKTLRPPASVTRLDALAISAATAAALAPLPWAHIRVASHPNQDALLALLT